VRSHSILNLLRLSRQFGDLNNPLVNEESCLKLQTAIFLLPSIAAFVSPDIVFPPTSLPNNAPSEAALQLCHYWQVVGAELIPDVVPSHVPLV
jgi:hypothetical protein